MKMNVSDLFENHGNVVGYVAAVAAELHRFAEHAEPPEGFPSNLSEQVRACARQFAAVMDAAAQVLVEPPVCMLAVAARARETEEPEIRLTSRKVAQA